MCSAEPLGESVRSESSPAGGCRTGWLLDRTILAVRRPRRASGTGGAGVRRALGLGQRFVQFGGRLRQLVAMGDVIGGNARD